MQKAKPINPTIFFIYMFLLSITLLPFRYRFPQTLGDRCSRDSPSIYHRSQSVGYLTQTAPYDAARDT